MASRPHGLEGIEGGEEGKQGKEEEAECDGGLVGAADVVAVADGRAQVDGQGYRPGKPEYRGDGEKGERREPVKQPREVQRSEADVGEHQEGPDRIEEHEVDLARRSVIVGGVKRAHHCVTTALDRQKAHDKDQEAWLGAYHRQSSLVR